MQELKVLGSFMKGFQRNNASDVINALYIADKALNVKPPFDFENRDSNGVESREIRKLLFFNCDSLKGEENEFYHIGLKMSKTPSEDLKWTAQFLRNGNVHLFPSEAEKAKEVIKNLKK